MPLLERRRRCLASLLRRCSLLAAPIAVINKQAHLGQLVKGLLREERGCRGVGVHRRCGGLSSTWARLGSNPKALRKPGSPELLYTDELSVQSAPSRRPKGGRVSLSPHMTPSLTPFSLNEHDHTAKPRSSRASKTLVSKPAPFASPLAAQTPAVQVRSCCRLSCRQRCQTQLRGMPCYGAPKAAPPTVDVTYTSCLGSADACGAPHDCGRGLESQPTLFRFSAPSSPLSHGHG